MSLFHIGIQLSQGVVIGSVCHGKKNQELEKTKDKLRVGWVGTTNKHKKKKRKRIAGTRDCVF